MTTPLTKKHDIWEIDNLPNRITIFRMFLIPLIIGPLGINMIDGEFYTSWHQMLRWIAGALFIVASITDFIDGHIARKRKIITVFGSFLDPIADKFLVISVLIILHGLEQIPTFLVIILVLRELYITALRLLATERGFSIPVDKFGKYKTAMQMIAIICLIINEDRLYLPLIGNFLIYIAALLSVFSAVMYSLKLLTNFKKMKKKVKAY